MSFKKPFRSQPIVLGAYQLERARRRRVVGVAKITIAAIVFSIGLGGVMSAWDSGYLGATLEGSHQLAVAGGLTRARTPQSGDYWSGCDEARAAGVTPLKYGEPGYRSQMDGDGDGIACEPYYER